MLRKKTSRPQKARINTPIPWAPQLPRPNYPSGGQVGTLLLLGHRLPPSANPQTKDVKEAKEPALETLQLEYSRAPRNGNSDYYASQVSPTQHFSDAEVFTAKFSSSKSLLPSKRATFT